MIKPSTNTSKNQSKSKLINPKSGQLQTRNGRQAYIHKLPITNPLMAAAVQAFSVSAKMHKLRIEHNRIHDELKILALDLLKLKAQQKGLVEQTFDTSVMGDEIHLEILTENENQAAGTATPTGAAIYVDGLPHDKHREYERAKERIEDLIDLD